ncbi:MAG TPA: DUF1080 domain-containing protein [Verrucomicrobiae bacterium]|nr:DUF1080 domain-containing protein [Verrucomicrobiae bacterium]
MKSAVILLVSVLPAFAWHDLFSGKDFTGWDTYLAKPYGLNNDPKGVFTVVQTDGAPAIRISGEVYGAITTHEAFTNFHIRVDFKWGEKRWPARANVARDSGILYCCQGPHGAGSGAWMLSVENNVMEKGIGQWWSVAGAIIDVEGEHITPEMEPRIPYKKEGKGEQNIVYKKGAQRITAAPHNGITPSFDDEKPRGEWNTVEVIYWADQCLHLLNGKVNMVLSNPRWVKGNVVTPLRSGKIQLQSEAAEVFYRNIQVRHLDEIPSEHLHLIPQAQDDDTGFVELLGAGWKQCGPGSFSLDGRVATAKGGMGLWWYGDRIFTNFVLRCEFVQEQDGADSGIFVRFPNPGNDPWTAVKRGHEVEIGNANDPKPTWRTGSIYPFHAPAKSNAKAAGHWNDCEIVCVDHSYSVRINGELINTWTDSSQRSASGYIGLQNYDDGKTVRFRKLRVKPLP